MKNGSIAFLIAAALMCLGACIANTVSTSTSRDDFKAYIIKWEGCVKEPVVNDGVITVGIGHRIMTHEGGHDIHLTDADVERLYQDDLKTAFACARASITSFDTLPQKVQWVVLSVIWSVGPTRFQDFSGFQLALNHHMYQIAAVELASSKWFRQVAPARAMEHYNSLKSASDSR